ncbi:hypothetical protein HUU51_00270 [Candidatus Gracilibacteria bacterium]|nr:hypothetical protein [Candidatus Gracilibacteria bacterium]
MNKPAPMIGKGKKKTDRRLWLMKYERDQARIDSEYFPLNYKSKKKKVKIVANEFTIEEEKQELFVCNNQETEKKKFSIKSYILWLIFCFFPVLKTSS